jgi:hypothetical protein
MTRIEKLVHDMMTRHYEDEPEGLYDPAQYVADIKEYLKERDAAIIGPDLQISDKMKAQAAQARNLVNSIKDTQRGRALSYDEGAA